MENLDAYPKYYNLAGRFTESEKGFRKYLKRELAFYEKLHKQAIEKGAYGIKRANREKNKDVELDKLLSY